MDARDNREEAVLNQFLQQRLADREDGRQRSLAEYQALFAGHESLIARELEPAERASDSLAGHVLGATGAAGVREGVRIGAYRLFGELGRGGQGSVWRAEDTRLGRSVALKVLDARLGWSAEALARFRREVALTARLDHPGICVVHEADTAAGTPYIAMQLHEGETLAARLARARAEGRPTECNTAARWIAEAARALHAAHGAGVVHRDVKPANLMLTASQRVVVLDFGLARELDGASLTGTGDVFGTPTYMAPEQVEGKPASAATDIWALGVTLFEALVLEPPFRAPTREALFRRILSEAPAPARSGGRALPRDLAVILATALAKEPGRRYASALALAEDLDAFCERRPIAARPQGPLARAARWARREPRHASLAAGLGLAVLAAAALLGHTLATRGAVRAGRAALAEEERQAIVRSVASGFATPATVARLGEIVDENPELIAQRAHLATQLARGGDVEGALRRLEQAPAEQAENAALERARALVHLHAGERERAETLDRELAPPRSELEATLTSVFAELAGGPDAYPRAHREALRALFLDPDVSEHHLERFVQTATMARKVDEAALVAEVLVQRFPDSALAWLYAASPWSIEDLPRARAAFERSIALDPGLGLAYAGLGSLMIELGDLEGSRRTFARALELLATREQLGTLEIRAAQLEHHGHLELALEAAETAHQLAPERADLALLRGRLLQSLDRNDEADEVLGALLDREPGNAEARRLLGL